MIGNLKQATIVARVHLQSLYPKRCVTLVGEGYWAGWAWNVELDVGVITDVHHFVLLVYPNGEIKQIVHDTPK